jgi:hypothetical protein
MFRPGSDMIGLSAGGTTKVFINKNGLGINGAPASQFSIYNTGGQSENLVETFVSGVASFSMRGYGSGSSTTVSSQSAGILELRDKSGINNNFSGIYAQDNAGSNLSGQAFIMTDPTNNIGEISWLTRASGAGLSEKMRLSSQGFLGIGTNAPKQALDVKGNLKLSGNIMSDGDICIGVCQ